jgi:hypothetical protein
MTRVRLLPVLVLCCLGLALAAIPAQAKDECCIVFCGSGPTTCHHWDTVPLWADAKCSFLYALAACSGGEAQVHAGNCSDDNNCNAGNTTHSPKAEGRGAVCKKDSDCPGSTRCADLALRRNRCEIPCESDNDCPTGNKCKKPQRSTFAYCK